MDRTWIAVGIEIPAELHAFRDMCTSCLADLRVVIAWPQSCNWDLMRIVEPGHIMKLLVDVRGLYVCNFIVYLTNNHL